MKSATLKGRGTGRAALTAVRVEGLSRGKAEIATGLSLPMITWARRILRFGTPELVDAVENGAVALYMAAKVARWPAEKQRRFVTNDENVGDTITEKSYRERGIASTR